jgi:hypothetical protein
MELEEINVENFGFDHRYQIRITKKGIMSTVTLRSQNQSFASKYYLCNILSKKGNDLWVDGSTRVESSQVVK